MTAKELLDSKRTSTINVVKLMEEYAQIKISEYKDKLYSEISTINRFEQVKKRIEKINI